MDSLLKSLFGSSSAAASDDPSQLEKQQQQPPTTPDRRHHTDREILHETLKDSAEDAAAAADGGDDRLPFSPSARLLSLKNVKLYTLPNHDFCKYLSGTWKRTLEWREFGAGFAHLRTSNVAVLIEPHQKLDSEIGARYLKWSFGRTLSRADLRTGYIMKFVMNSKTGESAMEWQYSGALCTGRFLPATGVAILNFIVKSACVTVTYRVLDADSMGVCIVEVDDQKLPTIQYGTMYRIDPTLYR